MVVQQTAPVQTVETPSLHVHAMKNLRFIRETMERSASFTAVPGWGTMGMGATALATAVAASQVSADLWLYYWMVEALIAFSIGMFSMARKAKIANVPLFSGVGWRFMLNLFVPIASGIPLTVVLYQQGQVSVLPGLWLLLYGIGVVTGGAFSVRTVPVMGFFIILTGVASLFSLPEFGNLFLAIGFGCWHILFGGIVAWRHGG